MNLVQVQNDLQMLPDQALQQQLLKPSGMVPSFLVMGELQRRKEMRMGGPQGQQAPQGNMAEEFARGLGQADVGNYSQAMGQAMQAQGAPPPPPPQPIPPSLGQPPGGMNPQPPMQGPPQGPPQQMPPAQMAGGGSTDDALRRAWLSARGYTADPSGAGGGRVADTYNDAANSGLIGYAPNQGEGISGASIDPILWREKVLDALKRNRTSNPLYPSEEDYDRGYGPSGIDPDHRFVAPGYADGGEVGDYTPYLEALRRLRAIQQRQGMSLPPGGMPQAQQAPNTPPIALPQIPPQTVPQGPPSPPDERTMLQRFQGAMANQSPDASVMAADALKNLPPMNFDGGMPQAQAYAEMLRRSEQDYRPLSNRPKGTSLGQEMSNRLMGRSSEMPRTNIAGLMDNPPDVPNAQGAPRQPGGDQGYFGRPLETPRMSQAGETGADWLSGNQFANALRQPRTSLEDPSRPPLPDGPPLDRPFTGGPTRGPGMPLTGAPPVGGGLPTPPGQPPTGGAPRGAGGRPAPGGGAMVNQPLADVVDQFEGARAPDRYADLIAQNKARKEGLGAGLEGDKGMALLAAGLGIMGGTSQYPLVNIGRGSMAGVESWKDASKELRLAEKDIYNADQALAIAQANRDERATEMAFKAKTLAEEGRQRAADRMEARAGRGAASADAAANRTAMQELRKMEFEDNKMTRQQRIEETQIEHLGTAANRYLREADVLEGKAATLGKEMIQTPEFKAQISGLTRQAENMRAEGERYSQLHQQSIIDRAVKSGKLALANSDPEKKGYDANGEKLKKGQLFATPDGRIARWTE